MDEQRAEQVVAALRARRVIAHVERAGVYQFGVRVRVDPHRVAIWDTDGTAGLEAQVMRDGMLVGFVPTIPGSESFDLQQTIEAIAATDYDKPISTRPPTPSRPPGAPATRPAASGPAKPVSRGGLWSRLFGRE